MSGNPAFSSFIIHHSSFNWCPMPDMPSDPRQLARDILAGKISIEDLAREQARRRGGQQPAPPRPMNRPVIVPPAQPRMASPPIQTIPTVRQAPPIQPVRRPSPIQTSRPVAQPVRRQPNIEVRRPLTQPATTTRQRSVAPPAPVQTLVQPVSIHGMLRDPRNRRRAIILSEILSPPLALREPK